MINPKLGILGALNPRKKRGRKMAARRRKRGWGRGHMAWVRSFKKRWRRRYSANPRHYRKHSRRHYRMNPRRRSHRHYQRNPRLFGFEMPALQPVLMGGIGFVGTPMLEGFLSPWIPASITTNLVGKYAVKIGSVLGLTWLAKAILGGNAARQVGIGGGIYVGLSLVRDFAPTMLPAGVGAYVPMGAYTQAGAVSRPMGLGAPTWGAINSPATAGRGGAQFVPMRFRRLQGY